MLPGKKRQQVGAVASGQLQALFVWKIAPDEIDALMFPERWCLYDVKPPRLDARYRAGPAKAIASPKLCLFLTFSRTANFVSTALGTLGHDMS
jgi:hypothetical protein